MDDLTRALRAWHGSPHDFEEFRDDKIGTGEGTQAMGGYGVYGHSHYVAEERKVGEEYRDRLHHRVNKVPESVLFRGKHAGMIHDVLTSYVNGLLRIEKEERDLAKVTDPALLKDDKEYIKRLKETSDNLKSDISGLFPEFLKLDQPTQDVVVDMFGQSVSGDPLADYSKFLTNLQNHPTYAPGSPNREKLDKAHEFMLPHIKDFQGPQPKEGRLYELNLHVGPHELLDWDALLNDHHDDAAEKIAAIPEIEGSYDDTQVGDATGEDLYKRLVKETGSAVKASNRLLEHGIRGIRYKDQGSRNLNRYNLAQIDGNFNDQDNVHLTRASQQVDDLSRTSQPITNLDELVRHLQRRADSERDDYYKNQFLDTARWVQANKDNLGVHQAKPTYNYVIFDPQAIKIMRKLGVKGEVIKDFTDTGVHVKPKK